jgi:hypothetical protein
VFEDGRASPDARVREKDLRGEGKRTRSRGKATPAARTRSKAAA